MPFMEDRFGNPHSSDHCYGWESAAAIKLARAQIAQLINAADDEIVFTSGATESCNLALRGIANQKNNSRRNRIITVATEHPAVLETVRDLGRAGYEAVVLPVGTDGLLDLTDLESVLDDRVLIVSVMAGNNEIGVLQPLRDIARRCHDVGALFHTDATQAAGRIPIDVDDWSADLLSLSSHKVYGPKGVGALYKRSDVTIQPLITGGFQEKGLRAGTLPPALIVGFGVACEIARKNHEEERARIESLTERLFTSIREVHHSVLLFGHEKRRLVGNLNIGFPGITAEEVIHSVANRIAISSGSACASATAEPSRVLLALGLEPEIAATSVRISLGRFTLDEDVDTAIDAFTELSSFA